MSDWPSSAPRRGTVLPTAPLTDQEFYWDVDATNHTTWHMIWDVTLAKWLFLGGPPLMSLVEGSDESTASTTYVALTTAGPAILLPAAGIFIVGHGCYAQVGTQNTGAMMSYDIGATTASDNDVATIRSGSTSGNNIIGSISRENRKTFATAVTLTAKYRSNGATTSFYNRRWMSLLPVQVG